MPRIESEGSKPPIVVIVSFMIAKVPSVPLVHQHVRVPSRKPHDRQRISG